MIERISQAILLACLTILISCEQPSTEIAQIQSEIIDPLPSWSEGKSKKAIIDFVSRTTKEGSDFIPVEDRIACFDNDGTLWGEQPMYFQLAFAIDRIKTMAPERPAWKEEQPYKALLEGDLKTFVEGGEHALLQLVMTTHSDMSSEEFENIVKKWVNTAKHPKTGKLYKDMVYQPMLELLDYLRLNEYKTFIVSGGGIDFMRPWAYEVYGIPAHQVVGSSGKVKYEIVEGKGELLKLPELNFIDDKEGKPVGIQQHIGKRPVFTGGNSDGDYAMLQYTSTGSGPRFGLIVHHTDSVREVAYDRESSIGRLDKGLNDAALYNWTVVDMEKDWREVYKTN